MSSYDVKRNGKLITNPADESEPDTAPAIPECLGRDNTFKDTGYSTPDDSGLGVKDNPVPSDADPVSDILARQSDGMIQKLIGDIQEDWSAQQLGAHLDQLLRWLGSDVNMAVSTLDIYLSQLNARLKACGHPTFTPKQWRARITVFRKTDTSDKSSTPPAGDPARFVALSRSPEVADEAGCRCGIWENARGNLPARILADFEIDVQTDEETVGGLESCRRFIGTLRRADGESRFVISAADYARDINLRAAIYEAGGLSLQLHCDPAQLRNAVAALNPSPSRRRLTRDFGWQGDDGKAFLVPGGRITAAGFEPAGQGAELLVDLSDCELAGALSLNPLAPDDLSAVRRHLVEDWLASHHRRVTYPLLGSVAAALLYPFAEGVGLYYLWLRGLTGSGKSFQAGLAQHFFGDFGGLRGAGSHRGRLQSWGSTPNHIQLAGHYFRHALYVVDDYKPNALSPGRQQQVIQLLQAYHDGSGRGRLNADSTFKGTLPIRGLLISTGEDVPEHSASTLARGVIVDVTRDGLDEERGRRCLTWCRRYNGVTADLVRWLIAKGYPAGVADRVREQQDRFVRGVGSRPNAIRVAGNLALLAVGFQAAAEYLADVWPEANNELRRFCEEDLMALRDGMLTGVAQEQESQVFLETLAELVEWGRVKIDGHDSGITQDQRPPLVGRLFAHGPGEGVYLSLKLALAEVQTSLLEQGRPRLQVTEQMLVTQLRGDGVLLEAGKNHRLGGYQSKCVRLQRDCLLRRRDRSDQLAARRPVNAVGKEGGGAGG
jgi:hypothetical protein